MASRTMILSLLLSALADAAGAQRLLRSSGDSFEVLITEEKKESNSADIPTLAEARRLQEIMGEVRVSQQCLNTLAAAADKNGNVGTDGYFVFSDGLSNGYFSANKMRTYDDLPVENKFAFVTLACQCEYFGGAANCCQGARAKLPVGGLDPEDPSSMNEQLQNYVTDICATTLSAIGEENILPPPAEAVPEPPTAGPIPSLSPTTSAVEVIEPPGVGPINIDKSGGLSGGAIAGIVIASAAVLSLIIYAAASKKNKKHQTDENDADKDLEEMEATQIKKELEAIDVNGDLNSDAPPRQESPDTTTANSFSDATSTDGSMSTNRINNSSSDYYAKNNLLPGDPDEESIITEDDHPSFFSSGTDDANASMDVEDTPGTNSEADSDAQAIEDGNWEDVAASTAAYANRNENIKHGQFVESVRAPQDFQKLRQAWEV